MLYLIYWLYFTLYSVIYEGSMSFWQKMFSHSEINEHKNQIACVENDCVCKSNQELVNTIQKETDADVIIGIKNILASRGYSRKELDELQNLPLQ